MLSSWVMLLGPFIFENQAHRLPGSWVLGTASPWSEIPLDDIGHYLGTCSRHKGCCRVLACPLGSQQHVTQLATPRSLSSWLFASSMATFTICSPGLSSSSWPRSVGGPGTTSWFFCLFHLYSLSTGSHSSSWFWEIDTCWYLWSIIWNSLEFFTEPHVPHPVQGLLSTSLSSSSLTSFCSGFLTPPQVSQEHVPSEPLHLLFLAQMALNSNISLRAHSLPPSAVVRYVSPTHKKVPWWFFVMEMILRLIDPNDPKVNWNQWISFQCKIWELSGTSTLTVSPLAPTTEAELGGERGLYWLVLGHAKEALWMWMGNGQNVDLHKQMGRLVLVFSRRERGGGETGGKSLSMAWPNQRQNFSPGMCTVPWQEVCEQSWGIFLYSLSVMARWWL